MQKIDYNLLYVKSENSRMQLNEISHLLRKSPQRIKYSLSVLEKEGILGSCYALIDYSYFGLLLFRVYFKGGYFSEHDRARIVRSLENNQYVTSIYELTSDLVVEFTSPNPSRFNKELKETSKLAKTLADYKIILNLVTYTMPNNYLTSRPTLQTKHLEKIIGGDRPKEEFSKNEILVLRHLLIAPNARMTKIAEETKLNPRTVKTTMDKLTDRKIIRGYKNSIDLNALGIHKVRLFLKLHNLQNKREKELVEFCIRSNEIVQLNKTVGDWDMELDIEAMDSKKTRIVVMTLREKFRDLIERFDLTEFYNYYKRTYLPTFLFEEKEKNQD